MRGCFRDALALADEEVVARLSAVIDLEGFRDFWAMETLLGHWDGYSGNANNYYVYQEPRGGRLVFLPWGTDQAFMGAQPFPSEDYVYEPSVYARGAIARRLYQLPEEREAFRQRLRELSDEVWVVDELLAQVAAAAQVAEDADPARLAEQRSYIEARPAELLEALAAPAPELADLGAAPEPDTCSQMSSPIHVDFTTTWGSIASTGGNFETELGLDGAPLDITFQGTAGADPANPTSSILLLVGLLPTGRSLVSGIVMPTRRVTPGEHPFHGFETFGFVTIGATSVGSIGDGTIRFDEASRVDGSVLSGSLTAHLYQSACALQ